MRPYIQLRNWANSKLLLVFRGRTMFAAQAPFNRRRFRWKLSFIKTRKRSADKWAVIKSCRRMLFIRRTIKEEEVARHCICPTVSLSCSCNMFNSCSQFQLRHFLYDLFNVKHEKDSTGLRLTWTDLKESLCPQPTKKAVDVEETAKRNRCI